MVAISEVEDKSYAADFELHTPKLSQDDACLHWLRMRYSRGGARQTRNRVEDTGLFLRRLENDLSACAAHRWARFSRRSPVYEAISPQDDCDKSNTTDIYIEQTRTERQNEDFKVSVYESQRVYNTVIQDDSMLLEPSRHIFTKLMQKKEEIQVKNKIDTTDAYCCFLKNLRPFFGGYFTSPLAAGPTRFLLFPQWMHDVHMNARQPQEVPYFMRGVIDRKCNRKSDGDTGLPQKKRGLLYQLVKDIIFNVSFSRKFNATSPRLRIFSNVDAMHMDLYFNNESVERSFLAQRDSKKNCKKTEPRETNGGDIAKLNTVYFRDSGSSASFSFSNPRHFFTLNSAYRVAHPYSNVSSEKKSIASLTFVDTYDSAVQRFTNPLLCYWFPKATYSLQLSAGPGVEYTTDEKPWTVFGKLKTEWWVELPIFCRLLFRIRNQSALVYPLHMNRMNPLNKALDNSNQGTTSSYKDDLTTHSFFWATQGPRWDATLVRGFKDDYTSMHYASRWYTLVSAELASSKSLRGKMSEGVRQLSWMVYANACIMDSFANQPRASVGLSFSGAPKAISNAFNVITPFSFECSFNWWLKFDPGRLSLVSGLVPGQHVEKSEVRLSPAETFRHLRCGLTWKA